MPDEPCGCCGTDEPNTSVKPDSGATTGHWVADRPVSSARLPSAVRAAMGRFLEDESLETVGDCFEAFGDRLGDGGQLTRSILCHTDESTAHWGVFEGELFHFECFYDVVLLAEFVSSPVTMHTEAPDGTTILGHSSGPGEWTVTPTDATMSFGIGTDLEPLSAAEDPLEAANAAICPFVQAFSTREAYYEWAAETSGATIGFPLSAGRELATRLASPDDR